MGEMKVHMLVGDVEIAREDVRGNEYGQRKERKGKETGRAGLNREDGAVGRCTYVRSISPYEYALAHAHCTCKLITIHADVDDID